MNKRQSGFTLVEIAIVLVIIGLLLGGVLKGQEMIANARYKNLQNEVKSYVAAYYSFQDRFGGIPGDLNLANAQARINPAAPGPAASNGQIAGGTCTGAAEESCMAWQQLRYSNLISGDPTLTGTNANPTHAYGGLVQGFLYNNGVAYPRAGNWLFLQNIPSDVAARFDRETDDSAGGTGTVFCAAGCAGGAYPAGIVNVSVAVFVG